MLIISNKKSEILSKKVASAINADIGKIERKVFPDGEIYVRLVDSVKGKDVALISTTQSNDDVVELILTLSALKDAGAKRITCVIPHMAYQRQDEAFKGGEAISAKTLLQIYAKYADKIITVNAHFLDKPGDGKFGGVEVKNLDAFWALGKYFKNVENPVVIAPDEGAMYYARSAAKAIGCEYDNLIKKRIDDNNVEIQPKNINVKGKSVIILDDIISTGGTMIKAAEALKKRGARKVYFGCVHGIFTKGLGMFKGFEIVCTDSLPTPVSKVSLAAVIAEELFGR